MFGIAVIDVAIGLIFAYVIFSSICSGLFELFAKITNLRATHMEDGLKKMLEDPQGTVIVKKLYAHNLISSNFEDKIGKVTNIANHRFSKAFLDIISEGEGGKGSRGMEAIAAKLELLSNKISSLDPTQNEDIKKFRAEIDSLGLPPKLVARINSIWEEAGEKTKLAADKVNDVSERALMVGKRIGEFRKGIENWFDQSMESVSLWYKQRARFIIGICAFICVIGFNADTIRMAKAFWNDDQLRESITNAAATYIETNASNPVKYSIYNVGPGKMKAVPLGTTDTSVQGQPIDTVAFPAGTDLSSTLDTLEVAINESSVLPVGWSGEKIPKIEEGKVFWLWLLFKIVGLIFTVGAVSLGAPYWFDILKKLVNLRGSIRGGQQQPPPPPQNPPAEK